MSDFDKVKAAVGIRQYLTDSGYAIRGNRTQATWRGGTGYNVAINDKGTWYDHKGGTGGSVIDLCMAVEGLDRAAALHALADRYGVMLDDGPSKFKVIRNDFVKPSSSGRSSRPSLRGSSLRPRSNCGCPSEEVSQNQYIVTLTEGRNRQIRRTFAALGYRVTKLHRINFGKYELGSLKPGEATEITL